jgi:aspartyl-tRNA(Asn)/glutamyl-tRNA(Gln) amidotransferase subunit A
MQDDLAYMPATRLLALFRAKKLSPVEVVCEILRRLETYEGAVNAFILYDPETAFAMARASEERWRRGEPLGLLDGVPVAIKDTLLSRGWPRRLGSRTIDPDQPWQEDSPVVAKLRAAGAVFFGKTTTPEFGWKAVTDSPLSGVTRNPWNLERTPGGSSGGSAAALLLGVCPLATGTDAGGSIRIPASFCGIVGLKPSFGRVAVYPASLFGDVVHVGPLSRGVEDAALMLDAVKGPDSRDWASLPDDGSSYRGRLAEGSLTGKRIALSPTLGFAEPAPEVRRAIERAGRVFAELGAAVEEADPFSESPTPIFEALALPPLAGLLRMVPPGAIALMDPGLVAACRHAESMSLQTYLEAQARRAALGAAMRHFFERFDLLLSPTTPITAAYADPRADELPNPNNFLSWMPYTPPFNLTKNPSASIPAGFHDGLPIGLQVTGPLWEDLSVLQACRAYEKAAGPQWPSRELSQALAKIAALPDPAVKAKIRPATG